MKAVWKICALTALAAATGLMAQQAIAGHLNIVLEADLDGRQEVATGASNNRIVGDPQGRGEAYVFGIDGAPDTICYIVLVERIGELDQPPGNGRQAHIHRGPRGANGPVVVSLAWPQDGRSADCISETRVLPNGSPAFARDANGNQRATAVEILTNPEGFYVNVHNSQYPAGAVRGQLRDTLDTSHGR
ncbi:MAG: CHRD domain-containing protein [Pseudomonadota bacterium]|nr:CHRD domain-containing protein [Pseudomonadota bacterium]